MDLTSTRVSLEDNLERTSEPKRRSVIIRGFIKIFDSLVYFLGLCKSVVYTVPFCDFSKSKFRFSCKARSTDFDANVNMNFSALRRRLNPFEKREKKNAKPKYTVCESDSPPTLDKKANSVPIPKLVLTNTDEIADIFPHLELESNTEQHVVQPDTHKKPKNAEELKYASNDMGMGDCINKHAKITKVSHAKTPDGVNYPNSKPAKQEGTLFNSVSHKPVKKVTTHGKGSEKNENSPQIMMQIDNLVNAMDNLSVVDKGLSNTPKNNNTASKIIKISNVGETQKTKQNNEEKSNDSSTENPHARQKNESEIIEDSLDYDIISAAFKHAIIPEKLQTSELGLEKSLRNCFLICSRHARDKRKLTENIADKSPVIEDMEKRENDPNKKPKKRPIQKLAMEAAYIKNECDQINHAVSVFVKLTPMPDPGSPMCLLRCRREQIKAETETLLKYLRRLREYFSNRKRLACIDVFSHPLEDELREALNNVVRCIKSFRNINEQTVAMIEHLIKSKEAHQGSEQEAMCRGTILGQSTTVQPEHVPGSTSHHVGISNKKPTKETKSKHESVKQNTDLTSLENPPESVQTCDQGTKSNRKKETEQTKNINVKKTLKPQIPDEQTKGSTQDASLQSTPPTATETTTNVARNRSWKANRASELRCASPPVMGVNGLMGRRIITPIPKRSQRDQTGHETRNAESNLEKESRSELPMTSNASSPAPKTNSGSSADQSPGSLSSQAVENGPNKQTLGKRSLTKRRKGKEDSNSASVVVDEINRDESRAKSGGGDGQHVNLTEAKPNIHGLSTSTPIKQEAPGEFMSPNKSSHTQNIPARRKLLGEEETHAHNVTEEFTIEDEEIVRSFHDGGAAFLETVDVDNMVEQEITVENVESFGEDMEDGQYAIYARTADKNAKKLRGRITKQLDGNKSLNSTFNTTFDSNTTGNDTRNMSDVSTSFTSYIETNNTMNLSSYEVKPGHGDRPNRKKLQAEIKPKKKKTRGTPNKHLEPTSVSATSSFHGENYETHGTAAKDCSKNISFKDDKSDAKLGHKSDHNENNNKKKEFEAKPMDYTCWQTIDRREMNLVPDHVHYRSDSKLKDVEDMYSVSGGKTKKKKKRKDKKTKGVKPRGEKESDDEDCWGIMDVD